MLSVSTNVSLTSSTSSPRARTSLPPPQLDVESAHAAATSLKTLSTTTGRHAKLVIDPSNGVLDPHGPRDKGVELSDLRPRPTPSSSPTMSDGASLWPAAGGRSCGF